MKKYSKNESMRLDLLKRPVFEDKNILVINKPINLPVQGGSKVKISVDQLLNPKDKPVQYRLTHRIDKDTSGLLILAKTELAAKKIANLFKDKNIHKTYLTIVVGKPPKYSGKINSPIYNENSGSKDAETHYEVIDNVGNELAFLAAYPITGRKHQIRIHLNKINCPILGDGKYGGRRAFKSNLRNKIHLHSYKIELPNYFGRKLSLTAPLPKEFKTTLDDLGFDERLLDV